MSPTGSVKKFTKKRPGYNAYINLSVMSLTARRVAALDVVVVDATGDVVPFVSTEVVPECVT